jgi:signal transduction histidine kinase
VSAEPLPDSIRCSVSDTGPGIRPEDLDLVFEAFWQMERGARHGAGLGLPIAKGIIEAHGGTISVTSQPGVGTTFHFTLPWGDADGDELTMELA